jgi:hypothetical protein
MYAPKYWKQGLRYLYTYVLSSIIYNSQNAEATQVIYQQVNKQNVIYTPNGVLSSYKSINF